MTLSLLLLAKATAILIAALGLDAWLRSRHVLACAAMWNAALVALLLLPIAALLLPTLRLPLLPASVSTVERQSPGDDERSVDSIESATLHVMSPISNELIRSAPISSAPITGAPVRNGISLGLTFAAVYVVGVFACLIRLIVAWAATTHLRASGAVVKCPDWQERLARWRARLDCRHVELRQSAQIQVPLMVGFSRPAILLPRGIAADLEARCRDAVIVHELAHVLRGDFGWQLVLRVVQSLLWFHPLVWLAERRIHFIRERACDDFTIHALGSNDEYAGTLLAIASRVISRPILGLGLAILRTPQIAARIEAIAASPGNARCRLSLSGRLLTLLGCLVVAGVLGSVAIVQAQPPEKSIPPQAPASEVPASDANEKEQATTESPGVVSGEVVQAEGGAPIAGATVLLRDGRLHRATSDDRGRFRFEDIPQGHYRIWAFKEPLASPKGHVIGERASAGGKPRFQPVRLQMGPGKQINVTVTSSVTGQPIEGAKVELAYPDRRLKLTASDGTAAIQALLPERYSMTILAAGHARAIREIDLQAANSGTSQSVSLAPGGTVYGTVTDENQQPLAEAGVVFVSSESPVGYYGESPYADAQGRYRNLHLPLLTPVKVMARLKDYVSQQQEVTLTAPNQELELNFQLQRRPSGGSVAGVVTSGDGQPVAGASVASHGNIPDERREAKTDQAGRFLLEDVRPNLVGHELIVRAAGFVPVRQRFEPTRAGMPPDLAIKLDKGHSIRARVQNAAGEPVVGAYVDINGGGFLDRSGESLRTDSRGEFSSNSLPPGSTIRIHCDGYSPLDMTTLKLDGDQTVVLTLEPAGIIRGVVTDAASSAAIPQFRVRIGFSQEARPGDARGSFNSELGEPGLTFQEPAGKFTIHGLTSRMPFKVIVEAEGYEPATLRRVVAQPEADAVSVSLKKREPVNWAALSGKVIDHNGKPVGGVQLRLIVSASPSNGENDNRFNWTLIETGQLGKKDYVEQYLSAVTRDDGTFEVKELLPGKFPQLAYWGQRAPKGRYLALAKTKPGASQTATIQLPEPARVRGSFDAEAFPSVSRVSLNMQDQSFHLYQQILANSTAEFEFENLPPGKYWLSVVGQPERNANDPQLFSYRPLASRLLTVAPGAALEVRLTKDDEIQGAKR